MIFVCPALYIGWKFVHKTKIYTSHDVDLHKDVAEVEEYTRNYVQAPPK